MGALGPLDGPCAIEGSSVATGVTILDGACYCEMKLGHASGLGINPTTNGVKESWKIALVECTIFLHLLVSNTFCICCLMFARVISLSMICALLMDKYILFLRQCV